MMATSLLQRGQNGVALDIPTLSHAAAPSLHSLHRVHSPRLAWSCCPKSSSASFRASQSVATPCSTAPRRPTAVNGTLFEGASNITTVGLEEAEKLYTSLPDRSNSKHVMLIMHAPWCSHCKAMEPQVRLLAEGLAPEAATLSILALECNSPATSAFAKDVLGVPTLPAFCIFPRNCRTFYKFKGKTRDAESLLKFLNLVCNQHEEQLWQLPAAAAVISKPTQVTSIAASSVPNAPPAASALWTNAWPAGLAITSIGLITALTLLARAKLSTTDKQESGGEGTAGSTTAGKSSSLPVSPTPAADGRRPLEQVLGDIDDSLGRLFGLMLRLVRARLGLVIARVDDPVPAPAAAAATSVSTQQLQPALDVEAREVPSKPPPLAIAAAAAATTAARVSPAVGSGGVRRGGATVGAAIAVPTVILESPHPASAWEASQLDDLDLWEHAYANTEESSEHATNLGSPDDIERDQELLDVSGAATSSLPGQQQDQHQELEREVEGSGAGSEPELWGLTHEEVDVSGVSAEQVLALLAEEGEDVGKVLQRLLKQQDVQFKVKAVPPRIKNN